MQRITTLTHTAASVLVAAAFAAAATVAVAGPEGGTQKTSYAPAGQSGPGASSAARTLAGDDSPLVFSAPPRETAQEGSATYGPIAEYLSQVTGKQIVYKHAHNWLTYQTEMLKGGYDLVFDGPHFNGWRIANLQHNTLVKAPGDHQFVIVTKSENDKISEVKQLSGRPVCAMASPNLGTLTLLNQFDNPARQPLVVSVDGWENIYNALLAGRCAAAVLPKLNLGKFDPTGQATRTLYQGRALPNQAFSAGPRITPEDQRKIARALLAPEAATVTALLRETYAFQGGFVSAGKDEYLSAAGALKDVWGYDR
jgi:ABC-type phosphate/phosphonate transport system substrate-binding protein